MYPNPAKNIVTFLTSINDDRQHFVTILDHLGRALVKTRLKERKTDIDLRNIHAGLYFILISDENNTLIKNEKLVIIK